MPTKGQSSPNVPPWSRFVKGNQLSIYSLALARTVGWFFPTCFVASLPPTDFPYGNISTRSILEPPPPPPPPLPNVARLTKSPMFRCHDKIGHLNVPKTPLLKISLQYQLEIFRVYKISEARKVHLLLLFISHHSDGSIDPR